MKNMKELEKNNFASLTANSIRTEIVNLSQLVFEVTDDCNLKCKYCGYGEFYSGYDKREAKNMSPYMAKTLIDYLVTFWKENNAVSYPHELTISFYGGEPLLNMPFIKDIQKYVENVYPHYIHPQYSMTTNAMLLNRYMDYLVEHNFSLLISLDGDKYAQSYRVDRSGNNSFDRVYANIELLKEKYPDYFQEKVNFNAVLHDRNDTNRVYEYMKKEFSKIPMISELNTSGIKDDKKELFKSIFVSKDQNFYQSPNVPELINEMFYDVPDTKELYLYLSTFSGNIFANYSDLFIDNDELPCLPTGTCIPFNRKMFLTVNGKILACERISQEFALGYIENNKIEIDFEEIARKYNTYFDKVKNQCIHCQRKKFCSQCIFCIENLENNPVCHGFMDGEEWDFFVNKQFAYLAKNPHLYKRILEELVIY